MLDDFAPNKRSLLMRIFELLGIVAPPTLVNCWYCNQDSYLLPGSKQTPFYWHCNNCECDNVRDQNGDIVDRLPAMYSEELNRPITAVRDTKQKFQENSVCQDCQKRLAIIYALMKNYIPEEDDPSYATLCKYADEKMQEMHQKYPLCDECEAKLDRFAEEQRDIQRGRRIMEIIDRSQRLGPPPIKPSMQQYRLRGAVWAFFHLMTLYFIFYGIIYPPSHSSFSNLLKEFEKFWRIHILQLCTVWINLYQNQGLLAVGRHIAQVGKDTYWYSVTLSVHTMKRSIACLYMQKMGGHDDEVCGWSLESHIVPLTIFMACSSVCMYWHPLASKTYFEEGVTIMRWKPYKIIQQILCLVRFLILLLPVIVNRDRLSSTLQIIMIAYPTILVSSFFIVRVKNSSWIPSLFPRKRHDEVKPTANMQDQGDNDKGRKSSNISETNSSSLSPLPPDFRPTPEMLKAIKFMPKISSETPTEIDLPQEDPLEKVLNGLQKINLK